MLRAWVDAKVPRGLFGRLITISDQFFAAIMKIKASRLIITPDGGLIGESEDMLLYGSALEHADPDEMDKRADAAVHGDIPMAPVPKTLTGCLKRAAIINSDLSDFLYDAGKLTVTSRGNGSNLCDSVKVTLGKKQIAVMTCAAFVGRYLGDAKRVGICDKCVIVDGDGFQSLVAVQRRR